MTAPDQYASVRYIVNDVPGRHRLLHHPPRLHAEHQRRARIRRRRPRPAAAAAVRTRQLRRPRHPRRRHHRGRNRIHLIVDDLDAEIARLRGAGLSFRSDLVTGPGGRQILLADPDGNLIELFESAHKARP